MLHRIVPIHEAVLFATLLMRGQRAEVMCHPIRIVPTLIPLAVSIVQYHELLRVDIGDFDCHRVTTSQYAWWSTHIFHREGGRLDTT